MRFFSLFIFLFILSCSESKVKEGVHYVINDKEAKEIDFDVVKIIPLELTDSSTVPIISEFEVIDDKIILNTFQINGSEKIMIFDTLGRYIRSISPIGRSLREVVNLGRLVISEDNSEFLIKGNANSRILRYGIDGLYKGYMKGDFSEYVRFFTTNNNHILMENFFRPYSEKAISVYDSSGVKVKEIISNVLGDNNFNNASRTLFSKYNGDLYCHPSYSNIVYHIDDNFDAKPVYSFSAKGKYRFVDQNYITDHPESKIFDAFRDDVVISYNFFQNDKWIAIKYDNEENIFFIDKKSGEVYFNNLLSSYLKNGNNDIFMQILSPELLLNIERYRDIVDKYNITEQSNPLLVYFRLKL